MIRLTLKAGVGSASLMDSPTNGRPLVPVPESLVSLETLEDTRSKLGQRGQWLHVETPEGIKGYIGAWLCEIVQTVTEDQLTEKMPAPHNDIFLQPLVDGMVTRQSPGDGDVVERVDRHTTLTSLESEDLTSYKIGRHDQWLRVRTPLGMVAYVAAWQVQRLEDTRPMPPATQRIIGVNLDLAHPHGTPESERLQGLGWVRLPYRVERGDLNAAYQRYSPIINRYADAGLKVLLVLGPHTYGTAGDKDMNSGQWVRLTQRFIDMVRRITLQYIGQVQAYQIWQAPSATMQPYDYAHMLGQALRIIKTSAPNTQIITAGFTQTSPYARSVLDALPSGLLPDGLAVHPSDPFGTWLDDYTMLLPGRPLWITEWGARPTYDPARVLEYAQRVARHLKSNYKLNALIWNAWATGINNGYGLVDEDGHPQQPFYEHFRKL